MRKVTFFPLFLLSLILLLSACQGLGGEPRIVATLVPPTSTPEPIATQAETVATLFPPTSTPEAQINLASPDQQTGDGVVVGQIQHGTVNTTLNEALDIVLVMVDLQNQRTVFETTSDESGNFRFENIPFVGGNVYFTATEYNGVGYASDTVSASPNMAQVEANITIYDTTDDVNAIVINSIFTQLDAAGDFLEVTETIGLLNRDSRVYLTDQLLEDGRRVSLQFTLPPGAILMGVLSEPTAHYDAQTGIVSLTTPLYSGQSGQVVMQYIIPYDKGAFIEYPLSYGISGAVGLLINNPVLNARADWVQTDEMRNMNGNEVRLLGGPLALNAGDLIRYEVLGQSRPIGTSNAEVITSDNLLVVTVFVGLVLVVLVIGVGYLVRGANKPSTNRDGMIDRILRQIAKIEAEHEGGTLNHDVYQRRKAELEALLAKIRGDGA